jgi:hypothetical protein
MKKKCFFLGKADLYIHQLLEVTYTRQLMYLKTEETFFFEDFCSKIMKKSSFFR